MGLRQRLQQQHAEIDTEGSWAISYGDMITLLLTFFILFFSLDKDKERAEAMDSVLLSTFNIEAKKNESVQNEMAQNSTKASDIDKLDIMNAQVLKLGNKMLISFPNVSFFKFADTLVTKEGKEELDKFVKLYMPYAGNYILKIQAYTDNKPVIASANRKFQDNIELSALRAISSMRILQKSGIPLTRMRIGGLGELNLNKADLDKIILQNQTNKVKGVPLARRIDLVIEPEIKEKI